MPPIVPTVSTSGWVDNIPEKADRLLSYYFVSDFSQSNLHRGQILSLPAQLQQNGHDPLALRQAMKSELENYFGQHFDSVVVDVDTETPNPQDPNRIQVTVGVIITHQGRQYSLGRLVRTINSTIVDIIDINNFKGN